MIGWRGAGLAALCALAAAGWAADRGQDQWVTAGHDVAGSYHSPLRDIDASNASRLGFAWDYHPGTHRGLEATPLVVDGVLYTTGNFGVVHALDAATGALHWVYDPGIDGQWGRYTCCDAVNRGVAADRGRIYVAALDGYLHAIDARSGRRIWKVDTLPVRSGKAPYTITGTPVIAGRLVIIGSSGGDFSGARGYVAAFDADSGRLRWRFYTVPRDPALGPQDQPHLVDAVRTWDPRHRWETGGGGFVWDGISYDPAARLIYVGTGNAAPYNIRADGRSGGDNLYTASIIALHEDGRMAWHYQVVPGDMWDFDSAQKMVLADLTIAGRPRKVLMQASKNGYFYVLDRLTGQLISARPYAFANWTLGIDAETGRPIPNPAANYDGSPRLIFPWEGGAHSWQPMSFDPRLGLVFIPTMEAPDIQIETSKLRAGLVEGQFTSPIVEIDDYDPQALASLYGPLPTLETLASGLDNARGRAFLRAWDPVHQRLAWEAPAEPYWNGGVLSTDGGIVVAGDIAGRIKVYAAATGALLKSIETGTSIMAAPVTYRVGGVQYIAVMAGYGGGQVSVPYPKNSAAYRYGNDGRLIVLKLDGGPVPLPPPRVDEPLPPPPPREGTPAQVAAGEVLYNRYCSRCHAFGVAPLPDLRRLTPEKHQLFYDIVLGGILAPLGMGRFDDVLTHEDAAAIHAFIVDQAWSATGAAATPAPQSAPAPAGVRAPLAALPIVARVKVPAGPGWLATGFGSVWLSKSESHAVLRIDPVAGNVVATIPVGSDPELGIGIGFGHVWVPDPKDRTLTQIDPRTNRVVRVIPVDLADDPEGSIGVGAHSLWVLTNGDGTDSGTLARIDPASGRVTARIPVRPKSHAVTVGYGAVWVSGSGDGTVTRIDPRTNRVVATIPVPAQPRFLAAGAGGIWVLTQADGMLVRVDPRSNAVVANIAIGVPGEGGDISIDAQGVWVSEEGMPLTQVDPATNTIRRQYAGGQKDDTLRVGFGAAWIVDENHGEVWKVDLKGL